ncbi:MAG: DUF839 domain-containing protein, partial [Gammaproteobacteria bacterium]|nr:DUF839 domain-containing protein [Gammaproteobacteria bacterium]
MSDNNRILVVDNSGIEPESNFSANPTFASILKARMERRTLLRGGVGAAMAGFLGVSLSGCGSDSDDDATAPNPQPNQPLLGFQAIPAGRDDAIIVPAGYTALAFAAWGTPLTGSYPAYREGQNSGAEQEQQVGQNHDGMHFFPID